MVLAAIHTIFGIIDYYIFKLISTLLSINISIASAEIFDVKVINGIANRVYVVIGVVMLFKLVIAAIQFMVNPDGFDDKEKGLAGIIKKTIISLALMVLAPAIFDFLMAMQTTVISTIPKIVFGDSSEYRVYTRTSGTNLLKSRSVQAETDRLSDKLSFTVLSAFVEVNPAKSGGAVGEDETNGIHNLTSFKNKIADGCYSGVFDFVGTCQYNYMWLVSTAAGIFLGYVLLSMTLDIAIRTIKFGFIRILAPIPISSYVFSKDKLNKFIKTTATVYLDLFIRLAVIFFIIFAVDTVISSSVFADISGPGASWFRKTIVKVVIICGLFMFAKNAPKFITDLLGLQDVTSSDMKDMFTRAGGLAGTTVAGFRTAASNFLTQKERAAGKGLGRKQQIAEGLKSAAAGFSSATGRGLKSTLQGKGFNDVRKSASSAAIAARNRRIERVDQLYNTGVDEYLKDENGQFILDDKGNRIKNPEYYGYFDYKRDVLREKLDVPSNTAFEKTRYDAMEKIAKTAAEAKTHGAGKMNETPNKYQISFRNKDGSFASNEYKMIHDALGYESLSIEQVRNLYTMARNGQTFDVEKVQADGSKKVVKVQLKQEEIDALGTLQQTIEKRTSYVKEAELMATGDPTASPNVDKLVMAMQTNRDMFNSPAVMEPIIEKMKKNLKNFRNNPNSDTDFTAKIEGKDYDLSKLNFNEILALTKSLQYNMPSKNDEKYVLMKQNGKTDSEIEKEFQKDYNDVLMTRADILTGIKDSYEEVAKSLYKGAQIADNRAQKAKQAISNNEKKS